jgi:2-dehydropantoate 2-reductase
MVVTIVGAGAIGGVTGASLTRAGHDVLLVDQAADHVSTFYRGHTKTKTGIWRDLVVRKRKTEVEAHLGATLERAARHGLALPLTRRLLELIGEIEAGRRPMAWTNLDELVGVGR